MAERVRTAVAQTYTCMETKKRQRGELSQQILASVPPEQRARTYKQMAIAACIADALEAKGWSRSEFAANMHQRPSVVTRWLSGTHNFTVDTLSDIEEVLGIRLFDIANPTTWSTTSGTTANRPVAQ